MKNIKLSLMLSSLILIGCGEKIKVDVSTLSQNDTILAFGDSLTKGMGAKDYESYPSQLGDIIGMNVVNAGLNGDTAEGAIPRLNDAIEDSNPKLIILGLGGNDMLKKSDADLEKNLTSLVNFIKSQNIQVVLLATPQPDIIGGTIGSLKDAKVYLTVAKNTQTYLIQDVYSTYLSKKKYKSDLIHLNAEGYKLVAEDIAKELKENEFIQ